VIRVGIVDDHPMFRLGLMRSLERESDLAVVWDHGTVAELHESLQTTPVDVVMIDLNLGPGQDALGAITAIREHHDDVKVIVISGSLDWDAATAARQAGANGYLPKDLPVTDMVAAMRELSSPNFGRSAFSDLSGKRASASRSALSVRKLLTRREQEVLSELRRGRTNKEIAGRLGVSITTVNKHVQQVLKKLHVRTRAQAVAKVNAEATGRPYPDSRR
jgi:DNA-binding NarL/FixJ family response regulator